MSYRQGERTFHLIASSLKYEPHKIDNFTKNLKNCIHQNETFLYLQLQEISGVRYMLYIDENVYLLTGRISKILQ